MFIFLCVSSPIEIILMFVLVVLDILMCVNVMSLLMSVMMPLLVFVFDEVWLHVAGEVFSSSIVILMPFMLT